MASLTRSDTDREVSTAFQSERLMQLGVQIDSSSFG